MRCIIATTYIFIPAECGCLPACSEVSFDVVYSLSKWPASGFETDFQFVDTFHIRNFTDRFTHDKRGALHEHMCNKTRDVIMRDFARLNIYIADSNVKRTVESPDYTANQLVSDIGGQLGIWVGISIITLAECLELLLALARFFLRAKLQNVGSLDVVNAGQSESHTMTSAHRTSSADEQMDAEQFEDVYILRENGCMLLPCVARSRSITVERVRASTQHPMTSSNLKQNCVES